MFKFDIGERVSFGKFGKWRKNCTVIDRCMTNAGALYHIRYSVDGVFFISMFFEPEVSKRRTRSANKSKTLSDA